MCICLIFWCYVAVWPVVGQNVSLGNYIFLLIRCFSLQQRYIQRYIRQRKIVVGDSWRLYMLTRGFKWIWIYSIICFEFLFCIWFWWCSCWAEGSAILLLLILTRFMGVLVCLYCLMNRDIWCGVFELIFVPSSAYQKRCAFSHICWYLVSVWPAVGQCVFLHW